MRMRSLSLVACLSLLATFAVAHGNKVHVVGTVEKVSADSVVVKTTAGKSVEVKLAAGTMYVTRDGKALRQSDLVVGGRVVIHATPEGDTLSADEVRFSPAGAGTKAKE